jgi:hypothetical protein
MKPANRPMVKMRLNLNKIFTDWFVLAASSYWQQGKLMIF